MTQSTAEEQVMSRIMKLLALANDEGATPAERANAEERAERMMAQHMIDRMEAEQASKGQHHQVRNPIVDSWEVLMSEHKSEFARGNYEFDHQIIDMMKYVLTHCGVRVNPEFKYGGSTMNSRIYQIVGFPEDVRYAERIWFNVFKTFISNVNPIWDPSASLGKNAYDHSCAGIQWKHQVLLAEKAGDTRLEWPYRFQNTDKNAPFWTPYEWKLHPIEDSSNKPWWRSVGKLRRECQKYCKQNNLAYPYTNGKQSRVGSRSNFARSYRATIKSRLDEIRRLADNHSDINSDKYAVAIIDTKQRVDEAFYLAFPQYTPEAQRRRQEEADFKRACDWASLTPKQQERVLREEAAEEARWQAKMERERRNFKVVREDPANRFNPVAWDRGEAAAKTVNLRADEEVKNQNRKELS